MFQFIEQDIPIQFVEGFRNVNRAKINSRPAVDKKVNCFFKYKVGMVTTHLLLVPKLVR